MIPPPYIERLFLPWWLWLVATALAAFAAAELQMGMPDGLGWLPFAVAVPLVLLWLAWLGRLPVVIRDGVLRVDDATLPAAYIARVDTLDVAAKRELLGVQAHPHAFVVQRPWIGSALLVTLDDPDDPTPYWIISTRRPAALAAALASISRDA